MSDDSLNCDETAVARLLSDLQDEAWRADRDGRDGRAEAIARELAAARVKYADLIGYCD